MGYFEQYPWLLVPIIIVTVEVWNLVKVLAKEMWRRMQARAG